LLFLAFAMTVNLFWWRGDVNSISVGSGTNIQDNSLVHVAKSNLSGKVLPTIIGDNVTVGEHYYGGHLFSLEQLGGHV
jgi:carbonic anhydrase/acetyltransferase-like protein (isoleucine patch superfamily)